MRTRTLIFPTIVVLAATAATPSFAGQTFTETRVVASDGRAFDFYGASVAIADSFVAVGQPGYDVLCPSDRTGAVYVYRRDGSAETVITPADPMCGQHFGESVAASGDILLVGAYADAATSPRGGAAYVFVRTATGWRQEAKLVPGDAPPGGLFGYHVALDGDLAVVGAPNDSAAAAGAGAAYIFRRRGDRWIEQTKLTPAAAAGAAAGWRVAVNHRTVAVSAPWDGVSVEGVVHVYEFNGTAWSQTARLTRAGSATNDALGYAVALSDTTLLASAAYNADYTGNATVFVRNGSGWIEQATLTSPVPAPGDFFGFQAAIEHDRVVITSPFHGGRGAAWLFARTQGTWTTGELIEPAVPSFGFGNAAAVSFGTIVVSTQAEASFTGAAYVFTPAVNLSVCSISINGWHQRPIATVALTGTFAGPLPDAEDTIAVTFDGITLLSQPFSAFLTLPGRGDYILLAPGILARLDFVGGRFQIVASRIDLTGFDNVDGVTVQLTIRTDGATETVTLTPRGGDRLVFRRAACELP
jgi:hypothetical protein